MELQCLRDALHQVSTEGSWGVPRGNGQNIQSLKYIEIIIFFKLVTFLHFGERLFQTNTPYNALLCPVSPWPI